MIANIRRGNSFKGALKYNTDKISVGDATLIGAFNFKQENPDFQKMLEELEQMTFVHPVHKPVWHTSVNFAPEDNINDVNMVKIVREYMERMGFSKSPYVIFRHYDSAHPHVHVLSINLTVNEHGKYRSISDSFDRYKSKRICADTERRYGLVISENRKERKEKAYKFPVPSFHNYGEVPSFQYLKDVADYILEKRSFRNLYELNQLLSPYSVKAFLNLSREGKKYFKFTFTDKTKRKTLGVGGTARDLKLNFSSEAIEKLFLKNRRQTEKFLQSVKVSIKELIKQNYSVSEHDLDLKLGKYGLRYSADRIYTNENDGRQYTLAQLGIPDGFIKSATVRREYYTAFIRTVTGFRKERQIFYESTLIQREQLQEKLRSYAKEHLPTLSKAQVNVLCDGYFSYKKAHLEDIINKEKAKDVSWIKKVVEYINTLHLSGPDKMLLLKNLGIHLQGPEVLLQNSTDNVVHKIPMEALPVKITPDKSIQNRYEGLLNSFTEEYYDVIKKAISGKFEYFPHLNYNLLEPFLPKRWLNKLQQAKQTFIRKNIQKNFINIMPEGGYSGKLLRWKELEDEDEEEDEEETLNKGKYRKRRK